MRQSVGTSRAIMISFTRYKSSNWEIKMVKRIVTMLWILHTNELSFLWVTFTKKLLRFDAKIIMKFWIKPIQSKKCERRRQNWHRRRKKASIWRRKSIQWWTSNAINHSTHNGQMESEIDLHISRYAFIIKNIVTLLSFLIFNPQQQPRVYEWVKWVLWVEL